MVNGGDVPNILTNSDQGPVVKLKNDRMKEMGFKTSAEYETFLNDNLEIDPLHFTRLINPDTVRFYLSTAAGAISARCDCPCERTFADSAQWADNKSDGDR